ncbi:hypothetical protein SESBI_50688 [Sesbania bispinosa]|nr:hypothetical protein SESBI_50688 [Sesbania bispinosa]
MALSIFIVSRVVNSGYSTMSDLVQPDAAYLPMCSNFKNAQQILVLSPNVTWNQTLSCIPFEVVIMLGEFGKEWDMIISRDHPCYTPPQGTMSKEEWTKR